MFSQDPIHDDSRMYVVSTTTVVTTCPAQAIRAEAPDLAKDPYGNHLAWGPNRESSNFVYPGCGSCGGTELAYCRIITSIYFIFLSRRKVPVPC